MFLKKLNGRGSLNVYDILKNIAFFTMVIDHIGYYLFPNMFFIRIVGRVSMPIFAILFGYSYKKSNIQILICGIATTLIHLYFGYQLFPLNILYTMYISGFALERLKDYYNNTKYRGCYALLLAVLFPPLLFVSIALEYGVLILYLMLFGALLKREKKDAQDYMMFSVIFLSLVLYMSLDIGLIVYYAVAVSIYFFHLFYFLIKKQGSFENPVYIKNRNLNWCLLFFSRFSLYLYPLHILLLILIKICLF